MSQFYFTNNANSKMIKKIVLFLVLSKLSMISMFFSISYFNFIANLKL